MQFDFSELTQIRLSNQYRISSMINGYNNLKNKLNLLIGVYGAKTQITISKSTLLITELSKVINVTNIPQDIVVHDENQYQILRRKQTKKQNNY